MVSLLVSVIAIVIVYFILDIRHVLCFPKHTPKTVEYPSTFSSV